MSTAAGSAKAARNAPSSPEARAARRLREDRMDSWRVFAVTTFVGVVLCVIFFAGAVMIVGNTRSQVGSDTAPSSDRIARIHRPLSDGTFCRDTMIDNKTAQTIEDKIELCSPLVDKPTVKAKPEFVWGGK